MWDTLFSGNTLFFSVPAVAGTLFFILRMTLSFIGIDHHDVGDGGGDLGDMHGGMHHGGMHDGDTDAVDGDPHHSTAYFKILSIQSIGAFIMGFGWGGLGGLRGADWSFGTAIVTGVLGGVIMVWLLTWLLKVAYDLQSSGTIPISAALGAQGEVYANIPAHGEGTGQVRVVIDERQRIYNAVAAGEPLPTSTQVRVVHVNENNTVTVAALE